MLSGSSLWWHNWKTRNILLEIHLRISDHERRERNEGVLKTPMLKRRTGEDRQ